MSELDEPIEPIAEIVKPIEEKLINKPKSSNHKTKKIIIHIVSTIVLICASVGVTYYWRDSVAKEAEEKTASQLDKLQKSVLNLQKQVNSGLGITAEGTDGSIIDEGAIDPEADQEEVVQEPIITSVSLTTSAKENIKGSITTGNTAVLEGYMAPSVNVILAATEAYGTQTPTQAVLDITSFIGDSTVITWDFALGASVISSYGQGSYSQYFPNNAIVGKSSDDKVISFSFDSNAKVSTVFMSISEDILQ